jgi:hypothetical protein
MRHLFLIPNPTVLSHTPLRRRIYCGLKNEICVVGLPSCDYVFSSSPSCFIAYGFNRSALEMEILRAVLAQRRIEAYEAGGRLAPAQQVAPTEGVRELDGLRPALVAKMGWDIYLASVMTRDEAAAVL